MSDLSAIGPLPCVFLCHFLALALMIVPALRCIRGCLCAGGPRSAAGRHWGVVAGGHPRGSAVRR